MGCYFLLQGIFPTQGSNPGLSALEADALTSEPAGKPSATRAITKGKKRMWKAAQELFLNWFPEKEVELQQRDHILRKKVKSPSRVRLFATPGTVVYQAPLSMGFLKMVVKSFPTPESPAGGSIEFPCFSSLLSLLFCKSMEKNEASFPFCTCPSTLVLTLLSQPDISFWPHQKDKTTRVKTNGTLQKSHRNDITYPCFTGEGLFLQEN